MPELLTNFPVTIEVRVAWGEMDALLHVNNIVSFRYFESARMAYFEKIKYMAYLEETGLGPILASTQATFKLPLTYPDTVTVGARISEIQKDRFIMEYRVASHKLNSIVTSGEGLVVSYNYNELKKAPQPEEIRKRILELENDTFKHEARISKS